MEERGDISIKVEDITNAGNDASEPLLDSTPPAHFSGKVVRWIVLILEVMLAIAIPIGWDFLFHNPWCNVLFQCGCTWDFAGGWNKCNIHNSTGPYCPWCQVQGPLAWTTTWLIVAVMSATYLLLRWRLPKRVLLRMIVSVISYFTFSLLVATAFKVGRPEYPYFLGWKFR